MADIECVKLSVLLYSVQALGAQLALISLETKGFISSFVFWCEANPCDFWNSWRIFNGTEEPPEIKIEIDKEISL